MPSRKSGAHQAPEKPRSSTSLPSDQGAARSQPNEIPLFLFFHCSRGYAADLPFLSIHLILCFTTYFRPPLPLLQLILPTTSEADHDSLNIITAIVDFRSRPISKSCERCANHPPSPSPPAADILLFHNKTVRPRSTMRRQNRSCDQCRKAKRACDAPSLWDIQRSSERLTDSADGTNSASLAEDHLGALPRFVFCFPLSRIFPTCH